MKGWQWLVALLAAWWERLRGKKSGPAETDEADRGPQRIVPVGTPQRRAENVVLVLLGIAALFALGFVVVYAEFSATAVPNELLGICLGMSLAFYRRRPDRDRQAAGGDRGARGRVPAGASRATAGDREDRPRERQPDHPQAPDVGRARPPAPRLVGSADSGPLAGAVLGYRAAGPDPVAAGGSPGRRERQPPDPGRRASSMRASTTPSRKAWILRSSPPRPDRAPPRPEQARTSRRTAPAGPLRASWRSRRSAPTPGARSISTGTPSSPGRTAPRARVPLSLLDV